MGEGQIAGILQCIGGLLCPVARRTPAVQKLGSAGDLLGAGAVETGVQCNGPGIQRRRHGQHLECGARLVAVGNTAVAPLFQPGSGQGFPVSAGFDFRRHLRVVNFQIVVGVVTAQCGHGQDLSRVDVHDDAEGAVLDVEFCDGLLHAVFKAPLDGGVDGQNYIGAAQAFEVLFVGIGHVNFIIALGGDDPPGLPSQEAVIGRLHPLGAFAGGVGEADDLGRQGPIGIDPLGGRLQVDAGNSILIDIRADFPSGVLVHAPTDLHVAAAGLPRLLCDPGGLPVQHGGQVFRNFLYIRPGLLQLPGVQVNMFHADGSGQQVHIAVIDLPPPGRDGSGAGLVPKRQSCVVIVVFDHQVIQPPGHRPEGQYP